VVPSFEPLETWAAEHGVEARDREELVSHPETLALYRDRIDTQSNELAQYERIQRFALLPHELTMDAGELTPTLKIRRPVVEERYADIIEGLYRQA
jgi:long-chain acyl-CoA synthetase